ncbi:MAG: MMPL family transporter [Bacteroidia bacterium]
MEFIRKHFKTLSISALILVVLITIFSFRELRNIRFDYDFESFFPVDDPELKVYLDYRKTYEYDNEFILLGIENSKGVFREDFLNKLSSFTDSLKNLPEVVSVSSPANLENLIITELGPVRNPLIHIDEPERIPADSAYIFQSEEYMGSFFSKDGKSVSIFIRNTEGISKQKSDQLLKDLNRLIAKSGFEKVHMASKINGQKVYLDKLQHEFILFFSLSFLLVVVFLIISFRTFWGVWIPILIVMLSIVWTLALMTVTGKSLDIMTVLLPTMMFVVGMSDVVHIVTKYLEEMRNGHQSRFDAMMKTIKEVGFATFVTLLTTALGFLTLINSQIRPINDFGIYTSLGVFIAFLLAYSIMPLVLNTIKVPQLKLEDESGYFWQKKLHGLLLWIFRNAKAIMVFAVLLIFICIWGISKIELNNYLIEGLTTRDELRQDFNYFEKHFSGVRPFEMLIEPADSNSTVLGTQELRAMDKLDAFLKKDFGAGFIMSPLTAVKALNKARHNGDPAFYKLPENDEELSELTDLLQQFRKRKELKTLMVKDGSQARITGKMHDIGSKKFRERTAQLEKFIQSTPEMKVLKTHLTGGAVMLDRNNEYLVENTLQGLAISILVVALIITVIHRNWRMVLIAVIPNLLPIIFIGGFMGFTGIEMKSSTSIIFSIAFGIATDDTIHFLARLKLELMEGKSVLYAIKRTFISTGKAVIVTSLILCGGFVTLIASGFESTFYFGLLVSITLFVAVLTDLFLFPVLVMWMVRKK